MTPIAILLCAVSGGSAYYFGKKRMVFGLISLLATGFFYGILRANVLSPFSHFTFDCALVGLYVSQDWNRLGSDERRIAPVRDWLKVLIGWPMVMLFLPFQTFLISLVGFRGTTFFLPTLLLGARLRTEDWRWLSFGLTSLNLAALGFGAAEYFMGVPKFYPESPVTQIIYMSKDVAGFSAYRIPAIFANAHAYAGSMAATLPILLAQWTQPKLGKWSKIFITLGIASAIMGVLMASTRTHFVAVAFLVIVATFIVKMSKGLRFAWILLLVGMGTVAMTNERFQRFKSIDSIDVVSDRVAGSVNRSFLEAIVEYPMGNGLGGGGTSIPFFLAGDLRHPVAIENEYGRLLLELGIIGLLLWVAFLGWCFLRPYPLREPAKRLGWCYALFYCVAAATGTGLLTSIPQTVLMLLTIGWFTTPSAVDTAQPRFAIWYPSKPREMSEKGI